jgi:hypothetical protein
MRDFRPTYPLETISSGPVSSTTSKPSTAGNAGGTGATPPPPPATSPEGSAPEGSASTPTATQPRPKLRQFLANKRRRWIIVTAAAMCAVIGVSVGFATSRSATVAKPVVAGSFAGGSGSGGGASNARSGPAAGGASGTVASMSPAGFTLTTSAGQKVTVNEASSTTYQNGTNSASASAITTGESVLALGTTNGTTITATQVIVTPAGGGGSAASSAAVIPFESGAPTASKQVGRIPANWNQGSGTIVSGTTANKATEAALAAYPGGIVDRVVQLSDGEYNLHFIGVNWPHHVFVDQNFNFVGAL